MQASAACYESHIVHVWKPSSVSQVWNTKGGVCMEPLHRAPSQGTQRPVWVGYASVLSQQTEMGRPSHGLSPGAVSRPAWESPHPGCCVPGHSLLSLMMQPCTADRRATARSCYPAQRGLWLSLQEFWHTARHCGGNVFAFPQKPPASENEVFSGDWHLGQGFPRLIHPVTQNNQQRYLLTQVVLWG